MSAPVDRFGVDLDALRGVVEQMLRCEHDLDALLAELTAQLRTLHTTWHGAAASAQLDAQRRWDSGFRTMHAGLSRMRDAGRSAHQNYAGAVATNAGMWDQLS